MRRFLLLLFTFLYLGIAVGATLSFHTCMGMMKAKMEQVESQEPCQRCGESTAQNDCCEEHAYYAKFSGDQLLHSIAIPDYTPVISTLLYDLNHYFLLSEQTVSFADGEASPSLYASPPLFVRNCVFLI